ncbi:2-hydroxyacid dehydrogenase [Salipiger aestuarii]|uniref:Glyoxylate/hydroxypyruvate reductase A n=1 Tax=Salipiger aestuarii TaxID=568098 RepID=A0A327XUK7_9RHOB|nr:glyoxylate/hydroxypyruvate reductase A [Salipiger aestuarii]EIE49686.1 D-2-hydroxyacid dehydrogenase protein [Citreicella sp. 357]KAA8604336.1 2-hydroxyacid dehydrogenase [Salipiger aestuarii]KAA8606122.1 2-hydroxyacid dehydrogenase [Salipiger aestuarii]KAB2532142.1 2-hydroxyacid dehydrogenase [Salipiger aestuarii]RAK11982.1 glyoxylate/hydroxypyruvate reductase A [Salipiger aestuarii]
MTVAVYLSLEDKTQWWVDMLADLLPGWTVKALDAVTDPAEVRYAVVWRPRPGDLAKFPNLRAVVSIGAGIDHVLADDKLPRGVPIIRTVGDDLTQRMREYVALHVLRHHRDMPRQLQAQAQKDWHAIVVPVAPRRVVGVMGLGNLGSAAARTLSALGFTTRGWSKSPKDIDGVDTFAGPETMDRFLDGCEILVNLLPLTQQTAGILNAGLFGKLAPGACVINCARGPHLVDADLIAALDSGQIKQATLDVFHVEPLPADSPFWDHPGITVTPHVASQIDADTGGQIIAANLKTFDETGTCADVADAARGY